ncbi:hypothetical protein KFE25_004619 [Diacronema lutheri]|uniref:Uncharacterized protein n=1 Tax=Diacronema lutheri TaxID=2081491 RepID=A0A8J5XEV6_DIALT|nr:hypothetical protein KFE25_004619 [Diacronema lutheri]
MVLSISNPPTAPRVQPAPQAQPAPRALPAPRERPARAHARPFVPLTPAGSGCGVARTKSNASAPGAHRLLVVSVAPPPLLRTPTVVLQREYDARCGYDHRLRREGGNYAHWLYDNYEALPPFMAFVHGHAVAWHQPSALPVLVRVAEELVELLERAGGECGAEGLFVPLGTTMTAQWCKHVAQPTPFGRVLRHTYAAWLEPDLPPPLPCLQAELGAQFVVSRSRVRARPRAFYRRLAEYTATCTPDRDGMYARAGEPKPDRLQPEHCFHNMLEYAWHVIFGQPPCDAERVPSPREQSRRWAWRHPGGRLFRGLLPYRGT